MTTELKVHYLISATNETYLPASLDYVMQFKKDITDFAKDLGISPYAIAGAMAEEYMNYHSDPVNQMKQYLIDKIISFCNSYALPSHIVVEDVLTSEEIHMITEYDLTSLSELQEVLDNLSETPQEYWKRLYNEIGDYKPKDGKNFWKQEEAHSSMREKLNNLLWVDVGYSNFRLALAFKLINDYNGTDNYINSYKNIGDENNPIKYAKIVEDMLDDTSPLPAYMYALYLKEINDRFKQLGAYGENWDRLPQAFRDALLITYANLGPEQINQKLGNPYEPLPGIREAAGMNHLLNARAISEALGLDADEYCKGVFGISKEVFLEKAFTEGDDGLPARYALYHLRPVIIEGEGMDYSRYNEDGKLDFCKPGSDSFGMTESYIRDRFNFLIEKNFAERPDFKNKSTDGKFYLDTMTGTKLSAFLISTYYSQREESEITIVEQIKNPQRYIFLSNGDKKKSDYDGSTFSVEQHIYGSSGANVIKGGSGINHMEGGDGVDTYYLMKDSQNTIVDIGPNVLVVDGKRIEGQFTRQSDGSYLFTSDGETYTMTFNSPATLTIGETTITFQNQINPEEWGNAFGIVLTDGLGANYVRTDVSARSEHVMVTMQNAAVAGEFIGNASKSNAFIGSNHNDVMSLVSGRNWVNAYGGDDRIIGGSGNDFIRSGMPTLGAGTSDNDWVEGGAGSDIIYAASAPISSTPRWRATTSTRLRPEAATGSAARAEPTSCAARAGRTSSSAARTAT